MNKESIIRAGYLSYENEIKHVSVVWEITYNCPYKCSYCPQLLHRDGKQEYSNSEVDAVINKLQQVEIKSKPYRIVFYGGEPTFHKSFLKVIHKLKSVFPNAKLVCTSNCFKNISFFEKVYSIDPDFQFNFSIHFEHININDTIKKIAFLAQANRKNTFNIELLPSCREEAKKLYFDVRKLLGDHPTLNIKFLRTSESEFSSHLDGYTEADYAFADRYGTQAKKVFFVDFMSENKIVRNTYALHELHKDELTYFKGFYCTYGMYRMRFNIDKTITHSACDTKRIPIKEYFSMLDTPQVCTFDKCICGDRIGAAKFKDKKYAPAYINALV